MTAALVGCKATIRREKGVGRNRDRWWLHIPRPVAALLEPGGTDLRVGISRHRVVFWGGGDSSEDFTLSARLWIHESKDRGTVSFPDTAMLSEDIAEGWLFLDSADPSGRWKFRLRWEKM